MGACQVASIPVHRRQIGRSKTLTLSDSSEIPADGDAVIAAYPFSDIVGIRKHSGGTAITKFSRVLQEANRVGRIAPNERVALPISNTVEKVKRQIPGGSYISSCRLSSEQRDSPPPVTFSHSHRFCGLPAIYLTAYVNGHAILACRTTVGTHPRPAGRSGAARNSPSVLPPSYPKS